MRRDDQRIDGDGAFALRQNDERVDVDAVDGVAVCQRVGREAYQRFGATAQHLTGLSGNLTNREPRAPLGGRVVQSVLSSTTATLIAGTSEIQRTVIATRGLGLPRG